MLRCIKDIDARNVSGGDQSPAVWHASALENQPATHGKSPAGTKPANKSGTTSSTGDQSTHS